MSRAFHTCNPGATVAYPNCKCHCPPFVAIGPKSFSPIRPLIRHAALARAFCKCLREIARVRKWYHRLSAVPAHRIIFARPYRTSRSDSRSENAWKNRQSDRHRPDSFFSEPPEKIFEHEAFKAKALKHSYSTILNNQKTLICSLSALKSSLLIKLYY